MTRAVPGQSCVRQPRAPVAFDIHLEDGGVVHEAVDGDERHCGIGKCAEGLIGGDQHRASLVACADEFEEHAGFGLILGDVCEIVEHEQMEANCNCSQAQIRLPIKQPDPADNETIACIFR